MPRSNSSPQIGVGANQETHVCAAGAGVVTERPIHTILQHAKQSRLGFERELVDLVDEQRSSLRAPQGSYRILHCTGKCPAFPAKQLGHLQLFWNRKQVDDLERSIPMTRLSVTPPRQP